MPRPVVPILRSPFALSRAASSAAWKALSEVVHPEELNAAYIIPSVFHPDVATAVAAAVSKAVRETGSSAAPVPGSPIHSPEAVRKLTVMTGVAGVGHMYVYADARLPA